MEHVLRSWLIAARLGDHVGLEERHAESLFYVIMLAWVGCVADTPEVARWFGDDIVVRSDSYEVDLEGLPMVGFMLRHAGLGGPALHRLSLAAKLLVTGGRAVEQGLRMHCLTTAQMAGRLGLGADVTERLQQVSTRWGGKGVPGGVGGEDIAMSVRLFHLADVVEVFHRTHGLPGATEVARARRGKQFDPAVVDAFCHSGAEVLDGLDVEPDWIAGRRGR